MIHLENFEKEGKKIINFLKKDLQSLRTNRASSDLVAHILIDAYGVKTPLEQLVSIAIPEPRLIVIQPWDKNIIKDIETALSKANLGALPTVRENVIHINLPPLNEDNRQNLIKILNSKLENTRVSLRGLRDEERSKIVKAEKDKEITEDDKYRFLEELDKKTSSFMREIENIGQHKEKEITTI